MSDTVKKFTALVVTIAAILMFYYGAYLPFRKSQMHISAIIKLQTAKISSLREFNNLFDPVLDFSSSVGQEEIVSYYLDILVNMVNQQSNKQVIDALVIQAEVRMAPILEKKSGFGFSQSLYELGLIYKIAAIKLNDKAYYQKAVDTFNMGLEYSPKRFIFLSGLLELYSRNADDRDKALEIGKTILKYYPNENKIREFVNSY